MAKAEMKNAPPIYGWAIATAAGALMFGVSLVVLDLGGNGAVAVGAVVALIVGIIFQVAETKPQPPIPDAAPKPDPAKTVASAPAAKAPSTPAPSASASSAPAPSAPASAAPASTAPASSAPADDGDKPEALSGPVGEADDLKQISGVGPVLEGKLNNLGIYHFWQIAKWSRAEVDWVDGFLNFRGRIDRDGWIAQASKLAESSASKPPS
jgi:NADH-quinone oxidoreductase subunit E